MSASGVFQKGLVHSGDSVSANRSTSPYRYRYLQELSAPLSTCTTHPDLPPLPAYPVTAVFFRLSSSKYPMCTAFNRIFLSSLPDATFAVMICDFTLEQILSVYLRVSSTFQLLNPAYLCVLSVESSENAMIDQSPFSPWPPAG